MENIYSLKELSDRRAMKSSTVGMTELIKTCKKDIGAIKVAFKGRGRQEALNLFNEYIEAFSPRERLIIKSATVYLYENNRYKPVDYLTAEMLISVGEIPTSHIVHYTSRAVLESIAKNIQLEHNGRTVEELVVNIRSRLCKM
jgi:hypothetical protein